ncbi:MAG: hypothetical protein IJI25_12010 [Eubacterium sp.]|nr:hypothetical protein [Eubacterium sp.]
MNKLKIIFLNSGSSIAYAILTAIFTFLPEDVFKLIVICDKWPILVNVIVNHAIVCVVVFVISNLINCMYRKMRTSVSIKGKTYTMRIEYGDLFSIPKGKVVINFDECFTTTIGNAPYEIRPDSVCGQYLKKYPIDNMQALIDDAGLKPLKTKSKFNRQVCYKPGVVIQRDKFLLMAFTKLDENGRGSMTYEEYLDCLNTLWKQIHIYHGTYDVYLPILGSGIVHFVDKDPTQQELLDIMIDSYRLSPWKLKESYKLHIVCVRKDGFSLNNIFGIE